MRQRGALPSALGQGDNEYVAGCFVGSKPRNSAWVMLADQPSATLDDAGGAIILEFSRLSAAPGIRQNGFCRRAWVVLCYIAGKPG